MASDFLYEQTSRLLRLAAGSSFLSPGLGTFSRVFQRYQRTLKFLRHFQFDTVVDGGANIGEFAALVRRALPGSQLLCVEPHPGCVETLRRKKFEVFEAALWQQAGQILSLVQMQDSTTSCQIVPTDPDRPSWQVKTLRLDSLPVQGNNVLIKLDLQGAEVEALAGMGDLWPRCQALILETPVEGNRANELRQICERQGFSEYACLNEFYEGDRLVEVDRVWRRV